MAEAPPGFVRGMNWTSEDARRAYEAAGTSFEAEQRGVTEKRELRSALAADSANVNDSVVYVDSGLSVNVEADGIYRVEAVLFVTTAANADVRIKFVTPGGSPTGSLADVALATKVALDDDFEPNLGATADFPYTLIGVVTFDTGGTFKVQFAQGTADVSDTHIDAGSYLSATRLA